MSRLNTLIFCHRQYQFVTITTKLHIAKLVDFETCYDPLIDKGVCIHILLQIPSFYMGLYCKILDSLNDEDGKLRMNNLIKRGQIRPVSD